MARVGRPSTFILHSLGTRAGTGPRANVLDDVRAADSAPLPPKKIDQRMLKIKSILSLLLITDY